MARVTVEDCLARVPNRFALTVLASRRARALAEGRGKAMVECENKEGVTALREIEDGRVRYVEDVGSVIGEFIEEQRLAYRNTSGEHTFLESVSFAVGDGDDDEEGEGYEDGEDELREVGEEGEERRVRRSAKPDAVVSTTDDDDEDAVQADRLTEDDAEVDADEDVVADDDVGADVALGDDDDLADDEVADDDADDAD